MKRTLTNVLALLAGAYAVHAQGTVSFGNYGAVNNYMYVSLRGTTGPTQLLGGSATGPAPTLSNYASCAENGNDWSIELYGAAGAGDAQSSLSPLGSIATFANGMNDAIAGTWASLAVIPIPGTTLASPMATVQLYAWYNEGGAIASFSQAVADGVPTGFSLTANVTVGGLSPGSSPNALPYPALAISPSPGDLIAFNFSVNGVPEPGTIALGLLGASALLIRLRR